jgi:hypothetical protein
MANRRIVSCLAIATAFGLGTVGCHDEPGASGPDTGPMEALLPLEAASDECGDPTQAMMDGMNEQLSARGLPIAVAAIVPSKMGHGLPDDQSFLLPAQWVPGDPRRMAQGNKITYLVDRSDGATTSGLSKNRTEAAIDRAMST